MKKVISINLNGNAYQIDEDGYAALVAYLEGAERQLKDNPDRAEILADLEQAIAEKCNRFLGPHKTVVTSLEVDQIIKEMGPVGGADDKSGAAAGAGARTGSGPRPHAEPGAPRRLYVIHEGAMIAGVCNGFAAYFHMDVTIIRLIFLGLMLITGGGFVLAYLVLSFVIPPADTSEERAAAHGQPFNAQELIDRAKENYAQFKHGRDWRRYWRSEHREWKRQWRNSVRARSWGYPSAVPPPPAGYGMQVTAGLMVPIFAVVSAVFFWAWIYAMVSLAAGREAFGLPLPDEIPVWVGLLVLMLVYQAVAWPLHAARRRFYYALSGPHYGTIAAFDGMMAFGIGILIIWLGYHYVPEVHDFIRALPDVWHSVVR